MHIYFSQQNYTNVILTYQNQIVSTKKSEIIESAFTAYACTVSRMEPPVEQQLMRTGLHEPNPTTTAGSGCRLEQLHVDGNSDDR